MPYSSDVLEFARASPEWDYALYVGHAGHDHVPVAFPSSSSSMADRRREPIEAQLRSAPSMPKPSAPRMSSSASASETSFDVEQMDIPSSKRKSRTRAKQIRKRRRLRYPRPYPEAVMPRPSSGNALSGADNRNSDQESASGDIEDPDSPFDPTDESVPQVDGAELEYVTNRITAAPEDYDSGAEGSIGEDIANTFVNAAAEILRPTTRRVLRRQPSEYSSANKVCRVCCRPC